MKTILSVIAGSMKILTASPSFANTPSQVPDALRADEAAIQNLAKIWEHSWNRRDAAGLASIMDTNVVFVSVLGPDTPGQGRGGRAAFEAGHAAILKGPFANSIWTTESVSVVRWLRPDIAVAHVV